jgi:glycosyltransferase involved in cell wall biosynthesis
MMKHCDQIQLSIIICTFNRAHLLFQALESLACQSIDPSLMEVLVVDNNSTDATREIAGQWQERFVHFHILGEVRQGLSHARNRGWKSARGCYVAFIDDDAKAAPDWAERLVRTFREVQPTPASVGGPILPWYDRTPPRWFLDSFETRTWGETSGFLDNHQARYGFSGSNMAFLRKHLVTLDGFDADYGMIGEQVRLGEETEFFMRLHTNEPRFWYESELKIYHYVSDKNMQLSFRFLRRFRSGQARAALDKRKVVSLVYFAELRTLLRLMAQLIMALCHARINRIALLAEGLQKICYQFGYLLG